MSKHYFIWVLILFQAVTAVLAMRCWNKSRSVAWRIFILIWVMLLLTWIASEIMRSLINYQAYGWVFNSISCVFYPCVLLIYTDVFKKKRLGRSVLFIATGLAAWALYLILSNTNIFQGGFYIAIADSTIIFFALAYLVKLLLENDETGSFKKDYYLWFSIGFIIYCSSEAIMCSLPFFAGSQMLRSFNIVIFFLTNYLLHIFLWIGFKSAQKWRK